MSAPATDWRGIGVAFSAGVVAATALAKVSPAAPALRADLDLSLAAIGWVMALGTLATALLGVTSGTLSARYGPRVLLGTGTLVLIVAGVAGALAPGPGWLLGGRAFEGLGVILVTVAAPAFIAACTRPADMGMAMGVWALWMPVGSLLMLLVAPAALGLGGWRTLWALSALAALVVLPALSQRRGAAAAPAPPLPAGAVLGRPGPWLLALVFACFSFQFFSVFTFLPVLLAERPGFDAASAALATALVPAAIVPGNLLGGWLCQRGVAPWLVMAVPAGVLIVLAPALLGLAGGPYATALLLAAYGLVLGVIPTGIFVQAPRLAPVSGGPPRVLGLAMSGQGTGILLGPPLAGAVLERAGPAGVSALLVAALILLIGAALGLRGAAPAGV